MDFGWEPIIFVVNHYIFLQIVNSPEVLASNVVLCFLTSSKQLEILLCWFLKPLFDLVLYFIHGFDHFFIFFSNFHDKIDETYCFEVSILRLNDILNIDDVFSDGFFWEQTIGAVFGVSFLLFNWISFGVSFWWDQALNFFFERMLFARKWKSQVALTEKT